MSTTAAPAPGLEEAWPLLRQHLAWLSGHWIGFITTPDPRSASDLAERSQRHLSDRDRVLVRLLPESADDLGGLLKELRERAGATDGCLWVEAVRGSGRDAGPDEWLAAWGHLLQGLNNQRDTMRLALANAGLLLVGPPDMADVAGRLAPDLWSTRAIHLAVAGSPVGTEPRVRARAPRAGMGDDDRATPVLEPSERTDAARHVLDAVRRAAVLRRGGDALTAADLAGEALAEAARTAPELVGAAGRELAKSLGRSGDLDGAAAAAEAQLAATPAGAPARRAALEVAGEMRAAVEDWAGAGAAFGEVLDLDRRRVGTEGTPEAERDLELSLDAIGAVHEAQGDGPVRRRPSPRAWPWRGGWPAPSARPRLSATWHAA